MRRNGSHRNIETDLIVIYKAFGSKIRQKIKTNWILKGCITEAIYDRLDQFFAHKDL